MSLRIQNKIEDILSIVLNEKIDIEAIYLVGSNMNLDKVPYTSFDSDIDIIILNDSVSYKFIHTDNIRYDIILIKNDLVGLLVSALNGSATSGKVFSSMFSNNIIYDKSGLGKMFAESVNRLYEIFTNSSLPNFYTNTVYLHNIKVNLSDLKVSDNVAYYFAFQRFSIQLLDYTSSLIYPFSTQGKYRGKVFNSKGLGFHKYLKDDNKELTTQKFLAIEFLNRIAPLLDTDYVAVEHTDELKGQILKGFLSNFYFGYDSLISENTIVFVHKNELESIVGTNITKLKTLQNIVPGLTNKQNLSYIKILSRLSLDFFQRRLEDRKSMLYAINRIFHQLDLKESIDKTYCAALIFKTFVEISNKQINVELSELDLWLEGVNKSESSTIKNYSNSDFTNDIDELLLETCHSGSTKENEIKICYIYFGILKALRIPLKEI